MRVALWLNYGKRYPAAFAVRETEPHKVSFANINAKAEGIENRPAFREALQRRRCLVPVDNFYEWKKTPAGKQPIRRRAS
jgi:putative SOS response-associated peptidase YedK